MLMVTALLTNLTKSKLLKVARLILMVLAAIRMVMVFLIVRIKNWLLQHIASQLMLMA
jgi:hypothetical protein